MTQAELVTILGIIVSFLITILGYFLHRMISQVDDSLKKLETEHYKDFKRVEKQLEQVHADLKTSIHALDSSMKVNTTSLTHLQKRMDDLKALEGQIDQMMIKVIASETKIDQLGKIIYVGKRD